ncbi:thioredoxin family protein [Thalassospira sp.]|uniref:DUF1223 domain-containing protein n=1 Tax=Thalassospira sp. TaxID=1912094 RepID=UPI002735B9E8|nr:DUF1223 domain-containing protein [Thalassospira sp.]MDP2697342.1 DUF1223 domain-containing protein [Thalassospira sp.]
MKNITPFSRLFLGFAIFAAAPVAVHANSMTPRAVVELYTSQGCNSCPPADQALADIAQSRDDILVLSFHVDYWNYLGWEDPFSDPANTKRQKDYASGLQARYVFTPQVIINGTDVVRAPDSSHIANAVDRHIALPVLARLDLTPPPNSETLPSGTLTLEASADVNADSRMHLWLVGFDRQRSSNVATGENAGRTLKHVNVVRELIDLGPWQGDSRTIPIQLAKKCDGGIAVLVQNGPGGPIHSAVMARF